MKSKTLIKISFLCLLAGLSLINLRPNISGSTTKENVYEDYKNISLYFCEKDDCSSVISNLEKNAEKVDCALYDIDLENIINEMIKKQYRLVTDDVSKIKISHKEDDNNQLMHDKFCIYDNKIISTGSFNPKKSSLFKDYNNLIVIDSDYLSKNYEDEFSELWSGIFGDGNKVKYPIIQYGNVRIENYFCPEDNCKDKVLEKLNNAEKINFLMFSFTDNEIAQKLIDKNPTTEIKGVVEKQRINMQYERYKFLKENGLDIKADSNPYLLHDKTWIIDDNIVIIGSYNPTSAGNTKNDENILIIYDKNLAGKMNNRFNEIYEKAQGI
ncbi:MAG: hypothetical protein KJ623_00645 [Nanoarchaeota archaeon]|nr:hypothetical protein [Nanoarchaeota archaeon]